MKRCNKIVYEKTYLKKHKGKFIVRLYDGFDNLWIDISEPLTLNKAMELWREKTKDGTENYCYDHIDYYDVFPDNTQMLRS